MNIFSIFTLCGGLAFFLYGMQVLSAGLEKIAGGKLEKMLREMTSSPIKGFALGAVITIAIQSSSALTVMLVGLVNSGIMEFGQTIGVIMGANVGTTLTAWILSLSGISSDNIFLQLLKPVNFSPLFALAGICLMIMSKNNRKKSIGSVLIGFSIFKEMLPKAEEAENARLVEEARVAQLKIDCEKKGLDFLEMDEIDKLILQISEEDNVEEYGIVAKNEPPYEVLMTKYISFDDVILLKRVEEMVEMYYNSNQFPNTIAELEKLYKSPFRLYEDLAKFYEKHNYFTNYPARSQRYKIFLNFINETRSEHLEDFRETLIKDYLLRETGRKAQSFEKEFRQYIPE